MARLRIELHAEMEDGATFDVVADQRDVARWEIQPFGCAMSDWDSRMNAAYRYLAWSAGTRQQLTNGPDGKPMSWDKFDALCVEVADPPATAEPEGEDQGAAEGDDADPGPPDRSAPRSSRSRGARAKR